MTRNAPPEPCAHPSCAGMPPMPDPTNHKILRGHPELWPGTRPNYHHA